MITKATVLKTENNKALVRAIRKSACEGCEGCSEKGSCHAEILLSDAPKSYELEVDNYVGAEAGDVVEVQSQNNSVLLFAVIVFVLPVIASIAAYAVSSALLGEQYSVISSVVSFTAVFLICAFISNKLVSKYSQNKISKIIKENSGVAVCTNAYKE